MADQKYSSGMLYKKIVDDKGNISEEIPFLLKTLAGLVIDNDGNDLQSNWDNTLKTNIELDDEQIINSDVHIDKDLNVDGSMNVNGSVDINGSLITDNIQGSSETAVKVGTELEYTVDITDNANENTLMPKKYIDDKIADISSEVDADLSEVFDSKDKSITSTSVDWDTFIKNGAFRVAIIPNDSWGDITSNHSPGNYNEKLVRTGVLLVYSTNSKNSERNTIQMYVPITVEGPTNRIVLRRGSKTTSSSTITWSSWSHIVGDITKDEISNFNEPIFLDLPDGNESVDLNDITEPGVYSSVNTVFYENCPATVASTTGDTRSQFFNLTVLGSRAFRDNHIINYFTQILIETGGERSKNFIWIREYYEENWSEWYSLYSTKNKPTVSDIVDFPESMANPNTLTITLNGGKNEDKNKVTYDGSEAKTINVTANSIGINNMKGATASSNGSAGLVPRPDAGKQSLVLKGDGSWGDTVPYADALATGRYIDGVYFDGSKSTNHFFNAGAIYYDLNNESHSENIAYNSNKTECYITRFLRIPGFINDTGSRIYVKFVELSTSMNKLTSSTVKHNYISLNVIDTVNGKILSNNTNGIPVKIHDMRNYGSYKNNSPRELVEITDLKENFIYELLYIDNSFVIINCFKDEKQPRVINHVIAAHDTPELLKRNADYVCDGYADQKIINDLINDSDQVGKFVNIRLLDGHYNFSDSIKAIKSTCRITGSGPDTIISSTNISKISEFIYKGTTGSKVEYNYTNNTITFTIADSYYLDSNPTISFTNPIIRIFESGDYTYITIDVNDASVTIDAEEHTQNNVCVVAIFASDTPTDIKSSFELDLQYAALVEVDTGDNFNNIFKSFFELSDDRTIIDTYLENFTLYGGCGKYYDKNTGKYINILCSSDIFNMDNFITVSDQYIENNFYGKYERPEPFISSNSKNEYQVVVNGFNINNIFFKIPVCKTYSGNIMCTKPIISFDNADSIVKNVNINDCSFIHECIDDKVYSYNPTLYHIIVSGKSIYTNNGFKYYEYSSVSINNCNAYNLRRLPSSSSNKLYCDDVIDIKLNIQNKQKEIHLSIDVNMKYRLYDEHKLLYNNLLSEPINAVELLENGSSLKMKYQKKTEYTIASVNTPSSMKEGADLICAEGDCDNALDDFIDEIVEGSTLRFLPGTYVFSDTLTINKTINMIGSGVYTKFVHKEASPILNINISYVNIEKIHFVKFIDNELDAMNRENQAVEDNDKPFIVINSYDSGYKTVSDITIRECIFKSSGLTKTEERVDSIGDAITTVGETDMQLTNLVQMRILNNTFLYSEKSGYQINLSNVPGQLSVVAGGNIGRYGVKVHLPDRLSVEGGGAFWDYGQSTTKSFPKDLLSPSEDE